MMLDAQEVGKEAIRIGKEAVDIGTAALSNQPTQGTLAIQAGNEAIAAGEALVGEDVSFVCGGPELADRMIAMVADAGEATDSFIQSQLLQGQKLLMEAAKLQAYLKNKAIAAIAKVQSVLSEAGVAIESAVSSIVGSISSEVDGLMDNWLPEFPDLPSLEAPNLAQLLPDVTIPDFLDLSCSE